MTFPGAYLSTYSLYLGPGFTRFPGSFTELEFVLVV
jgi:hypothetical protein